MVARSRGSRGRHDTRLQQLTKWCGSDFDGCLLFDECHRAKEFHTDNQQTKTARAVHEIQNTCPLARVVYCSATGITMPKHMGYLMRLALWGPGTPFDDFKDFYLTINQPLGARELVVSAILSSDCPNHVIPLGNRLEERRSIFESLIVLCWRRIRNN